ncbi:MAG: glycosyltransferase family 2 protein [Alphaproteobacteria bacterium]
MKKQISIVSPFYNEAESLTSFIEMIGNIKDKLVSSDIEVLEIILVNDGSSDNSMDILRSISNPVYPVHVIDLARNFGKEYAMLAGLNAAKGDAVILMDSDLQHPASYIPSFIEHWQNGYDIVYAYKETRKSEGALRIWGVNLYYKIMNFISSSDIQKDASDFRLIDRKALDAFLKLPERSRFSKGLFSWVGFRQKAIPYTPDKRSFGRTKFSSLKLLTFGLTGAVSFSVRPLRMSSILGFVVAFPAFLWAAKILYSKIFLGEPFRGYPAVLSAVLFMSGIQFILIGILGEYIGQIHREVKGRPNYIIADEFTIKKEDNS